MLSFLLSPVLSLAFSIPAPAAAPLPPSIETFAGSGIEVLDLDYEKKRSDVSITLVLQVEENVLSITSESYNYAEATDQLKRAVAEITSQQRF